MNNKNFFVITLLIGALFLPQSAYSLYTGKTEQASQEFSPTRLIVKLKPEVDKKVSLGRVSGKVTTGIAKIDELNAKFSVQKQEKFLKEFKETALKTDKLSSIYVLEVPEGTNLRQMKAEYENRAEVEYAELDYKLELLEEQPNDPLFSHQWYLNNTGQSYYGIDRNHCPHRLVLKTGTVDADIDALGAYQKPGERTVPLVAIIDTGVDLDHPDLVDNIWKNPGEIPNDGIDNDGNGFIDDVYGWDVSGNNDYIVVEDNDPTDYFGHGTHCAGIVAAITNNNIGVAGISVPCKIMAVKIFPNAFLDVCAKGIIYAADNGANIINMSWGSTAYSQFLQEAVDYAYNKGVTLIAAAGNDGLFSSPLFPAACEHVIAVAATNSDDKRAWFSSCGDYVDVSAPGEDVLSLRADYTDMYAGECNPFPTAHIIDQYYYLADGTSMASPCAVGVAASMLGYSFGMPNDQIEEMLKQSADDILDPNGDGSNLVGWDRYTGYGRVNLDKALQMVGNICLKIDFPKRGSVVSGEVAILGTATGSDFDGYIVEYGQGKSPDNWNLIKNSPNSVVNDTLCIWNTYELATGIYTLRLSAGSKSYRTVRITVCNQSNVRIASPTQGDTLVYFIPIKGSAVVPYFQQYQIDLGKGSEPGSWINVFNSTTAIIDDTVAFLMNDSLFDESGEYTFRLSVSGDSQTVSDEVTVFLLSSNSLPLKSRKESVYGPGNLFGVLNSPAVGDINGDGIDEIVYAGGYPAMGDLDGDGIQDVVTTSDSAINLHLSNSGKRSAKIGLAFFEYPPLGASNWGIFSTPVIADIDDDGLSDVLVLNKAGEIFVWYGKDINRVSSQGQGQAGSKGLLKPLVPDPNYNPYTDTLTVFAKIGWSPYRWRLPSIIVADLDNDGNKEVITALANGRGEGGLFIFDKNGNNILKPGDYPAKFSWIFGIAVANVDEDEELEIIISGFNPAGFATLYVMKKDGSYASGWPIVIVLENYNSIYWVSSAPAIGDIDNDGKMEILFSLYTHVKGSEYKGILYAYHNDGTPFLTSSIDGEFVSVPGAIGNPALADVNGDGSIDIIARGSPICTSHQSWNEDYERVYAWNSKGRLLEGFPVLPYAPSYFFGFINSTPALADIDKDGKTDIIIVNHGRTQHIYGTSGVYSSNTVHWGNYMHDNRRSGVFGASDENLYIPPPSHFRILSWTDTSAILGWNKKLSRNLAGYNLYCDTISGAYGSAPLNQSLLTDTTYEVKVRDNRVLYCTITCVNKQGLEGKRSKEIKTTTQPYSLIGLKIEVKDCNSFQLKWQPSMEEDIVMYKIYRAVEAIPDNFCLKTLNEAISYQPVDSLLPNDTIYVDSLLHERTAYSYYVSAVDSVGIESPPSEKTDYQTVTTLKPPTGLRVVSSTDSTVILTWEKYPTERWGTGYNIYRSYSPGAYTSPPINDTIIVGNVYQDKGLIQGQYYYYTVTTVNICNTDSIQCNKDTEIKVLLGSPCEHLKLVTESKADTNILGWQRSSEKDIAMYRIYRRVDGGIPKLIDSVATDTIYYDTQLSTGVPYIYSITAVDSFGSEGPLSDDVIALFMPFDKEEVLIIDETRADCSIDNAGVDSFYTHALKQYHYLFSDHSSGNYDLSLLTEMSHHPVCIIHSEDLWSPLSSKDALVLETYLREGGKLIVEGRRNLANFVFEPGEPACDYLHLQGAFIDSPYNTTKEFIGASGQVENYPDLSIDIDKVNELCVKNVVPGVGYLIPIDGDTTVEVIYTFRSIYDTSSLVGKPVAIRCLNEDYGMFYFHFPLSLMQESGAIQMLNKALKDLGVFADTAALDLVNASVFPNPFKPFKGHTVLTFDGLTAQVKIEIFTIMGERVITIEETDGNGKLSWNVTNSQGKKLASGIYIYRITNNQGQEKISKFAIIR